MGLTMNTLVVQCIYISLSITHYCWTVYCWYTGSKALEHPPWGPQDQNPLFRWRGRWHLKVTLQTVVACTPGLVFWWCPHTWGHIYICCCTLWAAPCEYVSTWYISHLGWVSSCLWSQQRGNILYLNVQKGILLKPLCWSGCEGIKVFRVLGGELGGGLTLNWGRLCWAE